MNRSQTTKDIFISYGRRESLGFVGKLHQQLKLKEYEVWFDKVNIPDGDDYSQRIINGIESADNFVFVLAPRCLTSVYCLIELEYAHLLGKRIIPVNQEVIFNTSDERALYQEEINALNDFYKKQKINAPDLQNTQDVINRSHQLLGKRDWLDAKEKLNNHDCEDLKNWADEYENHWAKHENINYLQNYSFPQFGKCIDDLNGVIERLLEVVDRQKEYVQQHTKLLLEALYWKSTQQDNRYLLVGKERIRAEEWLLTEFLPPKQPPCQLSDFHCNFICESRKNAENNMTDLFLCHAEQDKEIRQQVESALQRFCITSWSYEKDIKKGEQYGQAILRGIEQADNFLYFISPNSIHSEYCTKELKYALSLNKRIIPLLIVSTDSFKGIDNEVAPFIEKLQYIDFTDNFESSDFKSDIDEILNVLRRDEAYFHEHKVLLSRALKWQAENKKNAFLLRGYNLENAKTWLRLNHERNEYAPTDIHKELIEISEAAKGQLGTEVFISYSRKNGDFARNLNMKLQEAGKTTWFDQESISSGVDFEKEIYKGIDGADNFIFIISPDSVNSEYCEREVNYAKSQNKRFITILCHETTPNTLPEALKLVNWIDFKNNSFDKAFPDLVQAIDIDREHAHLHTMLQQRATEWNEQQRIHDFLLNATAYTKASEWLQEALDINKIEDIESFSERVAKKHPHPTLLQYDYIEASRKALALANAKAIREKKRLTSLLLVAGVALVLAILGGGYAWTSRQEAKSESMKAQLSEKEAVRKSIEALQESFKAEQARCDAEESAIRAEVSALNAKEEESKALVAMGKARKAEVRALKQKHETEIAKEKAEHSLKLAQSLLISSQAKDLLKDGRNTEALRLAEKAHNEAKKTMEHPPLSIQKLLTEAFYSHDWIQQAYLQHDKGITSVAVSPDGLHILTGSKGGLAKLWSNKGKLIQTFKGHQGGILSVAFSPDGKEILTGSTDKTAILWSKEGQILTTFRKHRSWIMSVAFSPDGTQILTGSRDTHAILWNKEGKTMALFKHLAPVPSVTFSPDGNQILTGSVDKTAVLWDKVGNKLRTIQHEKQGALLAATFSPDGQFILTGDLHGHATLYNDSSYVRSLKNHEDAITSLCFSPDGKQILTGSMDRMATLWNSNGEIINELKGHDQSVTSVSFSPDGNYIITSSDDATAILWNRNKHLQHTLQGHKRTIISVNFSPNGQEILTGSLNNKAILWSKEGKVKKVLEGLHKKAIFSPDGQYILSSSKNSNAAILWDRQGNKIQEFNKHNEAVITIAFSTDGRYILTGSKDDTVIMWDINGNALHTIKGHGDDILSVAFSPNGEYILTGSKDRLAVLWTKEGKRVRIFKEHKESVSSVCFSPDGYYILTSSKDNTAIIRDIEGEILSVLNKHEEDVSMAIFSPDGNYVLTSGNDLKMILWDLNGKIIYTYEGHKSWITSIAFSPDGENFISGSVDKKAIIWKTPKGIINHLKNNQDIRKLSESEEHKYSIEW